MADIITEASASGKGYIVRDRLYPAIQATLSTPVGDKKFKQFVGSFIDRNSSKLHTSGPVYLIPFADIDKSIVYQIFGIDQKMVVDIVKDVIKEIGGSKSEFKLLTNNPIFWVFYCCIRYYHIKKDKKGINTALAIYALADYPAVFSTFFPNGVNEPTMQYTIDSLTDKFIIKQAGHIFGALTISIEHSYKFLSPYMVDCHDKEIIRFIQRIRNDQKSMIKNICDKYMADYNAGNRIALTKDSYDQVQLDVDNENNTTVVEVVSTNIVNQIITNGLDLRRVSQAKDLGNIGLSDCKFYLSKIITNKYTKEISAFIHAIVFLYLYTDRYKKEEINSSHFLIWSSQLFRKTNSNDVNIKTIKDTLDLWAEETGVHAKFKREASRINYKKAIFWYFILCIQYYNK